MTTIVTTRPNGHRRVQINLDPKSKVEQHHKNEVDINQIVQKFTRTGLLPQRTTEPRYGDFTGVIDYHDAQNRILQAEHDFMQLPSDIRTRFKTIPAYYSISLMTRQTPQKRLRWV